MQLTILEATPNAVRAGYDCPCGCHPDVTYVAREGTAYDVCCCGNEFALGSQGSVQLAEREPFHRESHGFAAPWGEALEAVWLVGASTHAEGQEHGHEHATRPLEMAAAASHPAGHTVGGTVIDPVCGMTVDPETAAAKGLHSRYREVDYYFCGKGCKLDFDEDPEQYLAPGHVPSM